MDSLSNEYMKNLFQGVLANTNNKILEEYNKKLSFVDKISEEMEEIAGEMSDIPSEFVLMWVEELRKGKRDFLK